MTAQDTKALAEMTATTYADEADDTPRIYVFDNRTIPGLRAGEVVRVVLYREHKGNWLPVPEPLNVSVTI